jgi:hypothetical protein
LELANFNVLRYRISHIRQRGASVRAPGSGCKKKFTEEHLEAAKEVAHEFGGDISRTKIFETVAERFGPENVNARSQFLANIREGFKRRRIRYKPILNDRQK